MLIFACAAFLYACATKTVTPVQMVQPGDEDLSCQALKQQITANRAAAEEFRRKDRRVEEGNAAKNIGGVIPGIGLLLIGSMDLSNEEQVKARALIDRDEWLTDLAKRKNCMT